MIFSQPLPRVASLVSQHDFVLDAPAPEPSSGLPLSNGDLSASLYGGPGHLALSVRKGGVPVGEVILRLLSPKSQVPSPKSNDLRPGTWDLGPGTWDLGPGAVLHLYDATACVALPDGIEIEAFVAATRGLIVLRVRSQRTAPSPMTFELCRELSIPRYADHPTRRSHKVASPTLELLGIDGLPFPRVAAESRVSRGGPATQVRCDGPFRYLRQDLSASLSAVLCGFVYGARSHTAVREDAILATFDVPPSGECLILAGVATSQDGPDPTRSARAEVERALPHGYLLLQREHAVWWERFWSQIEAKGSKDTNYRDIYRSKVSSPRSQVQSQNP